MNNGNFKTTYSEQQLCLKDDALDCYEKVAVALEKKKRMSGIYRGKKGEYEP